MDDVLGYAMVNYSRANFTISITTDEGNLSHIVYKTTNYFINIKMLLCSIEVPVFGWCCTSGGEVTNAGIVPSDESSSTCIVNQKKIDGKDFLKALWQQTKNIPNYYTDEMPFYLSSDTIQINRARVELGVDAIKQIKSLTLELCGILEKLIDDSESK